MHDLMSALQNDLLAVIVLLVLLFSGGISIYFIFKADFEIVSSFLYKLLLFLFPWLCFPAVWDLIKMTGNARFLAIIVFALLVVYLSLLIIIFVQKTSIQNKKNRILGLIPVLVSAGLIVAGYLTYVEATAHLVECGVSIPGCVTVQTSSYAKLLDFLPIAMLGVAGYAVIFGVWLVQKFAARSKQDFFGLLLWGFCMFGVLFSIYLTFLEAFIIHATCSWCILSAVFMILLLMVSTPNAQNYFYEDEPES